MQVEIYHVVGRDVVIETDRPVRELHTIPRLPRPNLPIAFRQTPPTIE